jgi:hypothetical protein
MSNKPLNIVKINTNFNYKSIGIVSINGNKYVYDKKTLDILNLPTEMLEEAKNWLSKN